ncbi:MAG: amidohydrolase [Rhodospirillaceae bacterium]|nr:amidohydrolase [Rhodospirillaceae bacterium]
MIRKFAALAVSIVLAIAPACAFAADAGKLKTDAAAYIDGKMKRLEQANRVIWTAAEPGLEEFKSSAELQDILTAEGFAVESGVAGMPTAFVATYGSGAPVIGILAEFDALLGITQSAEAVPAPGANPMAGHACGHSIFGVGSVGGAIAVKQLIARGDIKGTVKLYGTPAEETGIGKVYMLRAGLMKDDDVILHWHAGDENEVPYRSSKALINAKFRFAGASAHASAAPYSGRSALDAVELMSVGVQYMREHIKQDARIHSVITQGGGQPNVVPSTAEVWYYVRANSFTDAKAYFDWTRTIAEGAAMMTQTTLAAVEVQSETHDMLMPRALNEIIHKNFAAIGPPVWDETEVEFAATTQRNFKDPFGFDYSKAPYTLHTGLKPLAETLGEGIASTDVGDVSWFVPTGGFTVAAMGHGLPMHSWPVVAATGTSIGTKAMMVAAKVIAATAVDLYTDPAALKRVKADFKTIREPLTWQTAIPDGQMAPVKVR